ncbi:MAG TPA: hypothetical protein VNE39_29410 [Planctomycetota bacterium]|nr:hypothetical protein [Planctomycetota bacterium]
MTNRWLLAISLMLPALLVWAADLPDPKSGGKAGAPISVLFAMGPGGAGQLPLDPAVAKKLDERGYLHRTVSDKEPLTLDYLRQFNVVVLAGLSDFNGGSYYAPGGVVLLNVAKNVKLLQQYVGEGGGLVVVPLMSEAGSQVAATLNAALAPWEMEIGWETVRDDANAIPGHKAGHAAYVYSWTRSIARSPLTEGVRALAYPGVCMRWDDAYSTTPLLPKDRAWKPLAWGEKTSKCVRLGDGYKWVDGDSGRAPVLAAAREAGKGRVAVVGLGAYYLLAYAFDEKRTEVGENSTGPLRGIAFERGDGKSPSDWGILFDNLLRWTAEASAKAGLGGKPEAWETKLKPRSLPADPIPDFAVVDWKKAELPPTWAHHSPNIHYWRGSPFYDEIPDPMVTGPQQMNKLLIGPRTRYSDGRGSIAQWARAAKAAGYRAVVFAERFEKLRAEDWPKIIADCERNSSKDFACLQGMDIADDYGNRYLILGNTNFPPKGILTPDGKGLQQTSRLSLGFSGHIAVVHRLGNNKGLPTELCRHFQGVSVYTYADDGKGGYGLADDAFAAYQWQLFNASNPIPIVVHELTDPRQVAKAAATGFQQVVPSQDALDAIRYFRYGLAHFFENPQRYFITEGPIIDKFAIFNKDIGSPACNRDHWRAIVGASSPDATIKEAVLYDRSMLRIARRWLPNKPSFSELVDGDHGHQRHFMLVVTDSKGRRAISPHLRTVPRGYFTRCADRQNWFGAAGSYTGIWPSGRHGIWYIRPRFPTPTETEEFGGKNPLATIMSLPFASNAVTSTGYLVARRYLRPIAYGMDAWRIENSQPSHTYEAMAPVLKWHDIVTGIGSPEGMNPGPMAFLTGVRAELISKVPTTPANRLFPGINNVAAGTPYRFVKDGQAVEGKLDGKADTILDLPAGASVGDFMLLEPLAVTGKGEMGWRAEPGKEIPAGTSWRTTYMYVPWNWRSSLGAEGPTPWSIELRQGHQEDILGLVRLSADGYGVAGTLKAGGEMKFLPLSVSELSEQWPAALWTPDGLAYSFWSGLVKQDPLPGTTSGPPFLAHIGILLGFGGAALPNTKDTPFYVGNTLMASDEDLQLAWTLWTATEAGIEVHNPTDGEIKARVWSAKAIPGKFVVDIEVTVPPGTTQRLTLPGK